MTTLFISHSSKDKAWAERTHAALSAGGYQCLFLDSHPDDGIHAGANWEQKLYQRLRQSRAVVVLCSTNWLTSPWCVAEAMMSRDRGKRVFLVATAEIVDDRQVRAAGNGHSRQLPDFLKDTQFLSLGGVTEEEACRRLLHGLEMEGLMKRDFRLPDRPYPGLEPFREADAAVYFGRDSEIDQVIAILNRRRRKNAHSFILVLGASGCGKSSLVRAGVIPRLRRANVGDGARTTWIIVPAFVGSSGLDGLALSLAQAFRDAGEPKKLEAVRGRLDTVGDLRTLGSELLLAQGTPEASVLLVLDQLEEVFSTPDGSAAQAMLRLLLDASADNGSPFVVLATMRSDFLNAFQVFEGAAERYEEVPLDPMPRSRFAEIIAGPADRFGFDLDPGLAERMAEETAYNDALPLLAFTLEKLYERCKGQARLTLKAYDEIGGVSAAIQQTADAILKEMGYAGLPAEDLRKRDLRRAFNSLAQVGEQGQFTRRIAHWSRMPASCEAILKRFVNQRLLMSDTADGEPVLSVAHEALFRIWDTLDGWLRKDRKALALRSQIEEAAAEWLGEERAASRAWGEERILAAVQQIEESGVSLADVRDRAMIDAFLGPTDPNELETLPAFGAEADLMAGSGRYGDAWRLPLSHQARASVGVRLALLGDRRNGVGIHADGMPDIDWCRIDGGDVTIEVRSEPTDLASDIVDRITRSVAPFRMARYPITVAQFRAFLTECDREGQWNLPPGVPIDLPDENPPPKLRARHGNQPVDFISWWDAAIFCCWLSARLKLNIRLPTEFEWQLAATGGDPSRTFPWGRDWDPEREPWRANTNVSGLDRTTAVGVYAPGASQVGVEDLAGMLWEWCQNSYSDPDDISWPAHSGVARVVRGGSWDMSPAFVRNATRFWDSPADRSSSVGFRIVCSA